ESAYYPMVSDYFVSFSNDYEAFVHGAESFVYDFSEKNVMEVWVIDSNGKPVVSSSGADINKNNEVMNDYEEAINSEASSGFWTGENSNGEKIMAYSVALNKPSSNIAVRYMISLEYVDNQLATLYFYGVFVCVVVFLIIIFSGQYFIRSIINPISKMRDATRKYAKGDYTIELDDLGSKELNELGESISYMISEIKDADRMKNDFISTISHELRTPLTAIKGWGETMLQIGSTDDELMKRGMNVIIGESQRLSELVEELLDFSRIQNGALKMRIEKMDVLAELDEAVFVFRDRATREGKELIYNAPDKPAPALGDANRITQVFSNILDNAIKYTEEGGKISVFATFGEESNIVITITDDGCGISEEDLPKVKEKFYKTNNTVRGSGIGLAVADEIIRQHNGDLQINSVLGKGTSVKIIIPIDQNDYSIEKELINNE
ncbi:MAG: HAMP domain-containing histidine kinase, partial [Clostridia bacterium]|nr:HAMP domain-containing histidine kinase [Clostridia bacterium]